MNEVCKRSQNSAWAIFFQISEKVFRPEFEPGISDLPVYCHMRYPVQIWTTQFTQTTFCWFRVLGSNHDKALPQSSKITTHIFFFLFNSIMMQKLIKGNFDKQWSSTKKSSIFSFTVLTVFGKADYWTLLTIEVPEKGFHTKHIRRVIKVLRWFPVEVQTTIIKRHCNFEKKTPLKHF